MIGAVVWLLVIRAPIDPRVRSRRPWALAILAGYGLAYLVGIGWVSANPLWTTGNVEIRAGFPENLAWAVFVMAHAQVVCVPITVAGLALYRRRRPPA